MMNKLAQFLQDGKGDFSHARLIALIVALSATVFMWKLTLNEGLTADYFLYYLAYGVVHQSVNKFLDVAGAWIGMRNMPRQEPYRDQEYRQDTPSSEPWQQHDPDGGVNFSRHP